MHGIGFNHDSSSSALPLDNEEEKIATDASQDTIRDDENGGSPVTVCVNIETSSW